MCVSIRGQLHPPPQSRPALLLPFQQRTLILGTGDTAVGVMLIGIVSISTLV